MLNLQVNVVLLEHIYLYFPIFLLFLAHLILLFSTIVGCNGDAPLSEINNVIHTLKSLQTVSTSTMSERHDQVGFLNMNHIMDHASGDVDIYNLESLVSFWLEDPIFNTIDKKQKNIVIRSLNEYALQIAGSNYNTKRYDMSFNDGKGTLFLFIVSFQHHKTNEHAVKWEKFIMSSHFTPAHAYVIITESNCNLLSCDTYDRIEYLPTTLTNDHINSILISSIGLTEKYGNLIAL